MVVLSLDLDADAFLETLDPERLAPLNPGAHDTPHPRVDLVPPRLDLGPVEPGDAASEHRLEAPDVHGGGVESGREVRPCDVHRLASQVSQGADDV